MWETVEPTQEIFIGHSPPIPLRIVNRVLQKNDVDGFEQVALKDSKGPAGKTYSRVNQQQSPGICSVVRVPVGVILKMG